MPSTVKIAPGVKNLGAVVNQPTPIHKMGQRAPFSNSAFRTFKKTTVRGFIPPNLRSDSWAFLLWRDSLPAFAVFNPIRVAERTKKVALWRMEVD